MTYPPVGSKRLCECGACHRGFALAARKDQEDPRAVWITPAGAARVPGGGSALTDVSDAILREVV